VCQTTMSSSSIFALPSAIHSGRPRDGSPEVWQTCRPAGLSWPSTSVQIMGKRVQPEELWEMLTGSDVDCMSRKSSTFPDKTTFLGKQSWGLPRDEFITGELPRVWVDLVCIADIPSPSCRTLIIRQGFLHFSILCFIGIKGIPVFILGASYWRSAGSRIDLEYGILLTVYLGIETKAEKVLVVVSLRHT